MLNWSKYNIWFPSINLFFNFISKENFFEPFKISSNFDKLFSCIDLSEFEKLKTDEEKRNFFGEKVYRTIEESQIALDRKLDADDIARITGMIINIPYQEIIEILEDTSILNNRIEEALNLLNK